MATYVLGRLVQSVLILIGVTLVAFFLLFVIPADPAQVMAGRGYASQEMIASIREQLGLDLPFFQQYFRYLGHLLQGDLGRSYLQKSEVSALIASRLPATLLLIAGSIFFEIVIGVTMGLLAALWRGQKVLKTVAVDRTQPKPRVSIIGEFWAMTTEGDGNYQLQRFLESEGAECDIQLVTAWILYNIWEVRFDTKNRATLREEDGGKFGLKGFGEFGVLTREVGLWLGDKALRTVFQTFAHAAGLYDYHLPDMNKVADVAAPYYDNDLRGGEGHMEVGKLILNVVNQKATMTLSVKPFGCMPSSGVSDGVQSLITERYPGTIFCAVETSGDGAVNFYSRVQMYLFKARQAAEAELEKTLADNGMTRDDFR